MSDGHFSGGGELNQMYGKVMNTFYALASHDGHFFLLSVGCHWTLWLSKSLSNDIIENRKGNSYVDRICVRLIDQW